MKRALKSDKLKIVDLLAHSFNENQSGNYIVQQDHQRKIESVH